jgi:hypothetical protein
MVKYCQNKLKFHLVVEKDSGNTWRKKIRKKNQLFFMAIFLDVSVFEALTVLERLGVVSTAANEYIFAPLSKQTESPYPSHDMRHLDCFLCQWHGLAIFRLGLPRSCC